MYIVYIYMPVLLDITIVMVPSIQMYMDIVLNIHVVLRARDKLFLPNSNSNFRHPRNSKGRLNNSRGFGWKLTVNLVVKWTNYYGGDGD